MATIPRRTRVPRPTSVTNDPRFVRIAEWWTNKRVADEVKALMEGKNGEPGLRKEILGFVQENGIEDADGNKVLMLPEPYAGLHGVMAQRRASAGFDSFLAASLLKSKGDDVLEACTRIEYQWDPAAQDLMVETLRAAGVLDQCVADGYPMEYLDPDLILGYHQRHKNVVTEEEVDSMLPDEVTWALVTVKTPRQDLADVD
jgi:hypothetical protein